MARLYPSFACHTAASSQPTCPHGEGLLGCLNPWPVVADQADVLNCALVNDPETCHEIDADGNIDIRGRGGFRPGADDAAVHSRRQAEAGDDRSDPPRSADPGRY